MSCIISLAFLNASEYHEKNDWEAQSMSYIPTPEQANELIKRYNKEQQEAGIRLI